MKLQAIFFDMGGTLDTFRFTREYRIANVHLIRECLLKAGISLKMDDEKLAGMITSGASAYLVWNHDLNIELHPSEIWSKFFLKGAHVSQKSLLPIEEELAFLYETRLFIREIKSEVPHVLASIQKMDLRMGLISNTQSCTQVPYSLQEYGIADYFDPIVLSSQYGRRKPDPAIFYYAARLANLPTGACAYVGDKINRDVLGARLAGFRCAFQVKHEYDNGEKDEGATPDAIIKNMSELVPLLEAELEKDKTIIDLRKNHQIKALFFDAGDVMYNRPHKAYNLNKFLEGKHLHKHPDFERESERLKDLAFSGRIKRHDYYEKLMRLYGFESTEDIKAGVDAMSLDDDTVEIIDGVPETINKLKENGFILGIITDTAFTFSRKLRWFDEHGFGRVWDTVISSKEVGVRKPSPAMYKKALIQTGVKSSQAVFIGHKKTELDGAKAVGLKTIAFNYENGAVADIYIEQFSDLLKVPFISGSETRK